MKTYCLVLFLLIASLLPCYAQTTNYHHEIAVREQYMERLNQKIHDLKMRKLALERTESEYNMLRESKLYVDRKVEEMRKMDPAYRHAGYLRDRLTEELGLSLFLNHASITRYADLERWIAAYDKLLPQNRLELENIERELLETKTEWERTDRELAVLETAHIKTAIVGHWILDFYRHPTMINPGSTVNQNLIYVNHNEKDGYFYGTVIVSKTFVCHTDGTLLFQVRPVPGQGFEYKGIEFGYIYNKDWNTTQPAGQRCRPMQARLSIVVRPDGIMEYDNGDQRFTLSRARKPQSPGLEPGISPPTMEDFYRQR